MSAIVNNILKPLRTYFKENIKEVVMNKPLEVGLEDVKGEWHYFTDKNLNNSWFKSFATVMCSATGQKFNSVNSIISFKLPEGHRVEVIHGSNAKHGFVIAIRLFRGLHFSIDDYQILPEEKEKIINVVKNKENILISGGTATGKTSFLNMLINSYVDLRDRIITIEGVEELQIKKHKNLVSLIYPENKNAHNNKDSSDLLNASLRMRPDRIIMGELRKENCFVFARAINTGHSGSMATIHANSPKDAISAMKENIIMNGDSSEGAINILDHQLKRNINGVIQLERFEGGVRGYFESFY